MRHSTSCIFISDQIILILPHQSCTFKFRRESIVSPLCSVTFLTAMVLAQLIILCCLDLFGSLKPYLQVLEKAQNSFTERYRSCLLSVPPPCAAGIELECQFLLNGITLMSCHFILILGIQEHIGSHLMLKMAFIIYQLFYISIGFSIPTCSDSGDDDDDMMIILSTQNKLITCCLCAIFLCINLSQGVIHTRQVLYHQTTAHLSNYFLNIQRRRLKPSVSAPRSLFYCCFVDHAMIA